MFWEGWQIFSLEGLIANLSVFVGYEVTATTIKFCRYSGKAVKENM